MFYGDGVSQKSAAAVAVERCESLNRFSAHPSRLERFYLTPQHRAANEVVAGWMRELGLRTWTDAAGNQWGRIEGAEPGLGALVLGSHLDTVPDGGSFAGPLGLTISLAAIELLKDQLHSSPFALEVVCFGDHEGARFATAMLSSAAAAGQWDDDWWDLRDQQGTTVLEAFRQWGLDPRRIGEAARSRPELVGYLETALEQGAVLGAAESPLAVVSSTASVSRFVVNVVGEARPSGATAYASRKDALVAAGLAVAEIEHLAIQSGGAATVGQLNVVPGGVNVIAGRVDFSVDVRHRTDAKLAELWDSIVEQIGEICDSRGLRFSWGQTHHAPSVDCTNWLQESLLEAADLPQILSWAGHEASVLAGLTDAAVLLVRSVDGIGHHPAEDVRQADVERGIEVLAAAISIAAKRRG